MAEVFTENHVGARVVYIEIKRYFSEIFLKFFKKIIPARHILFHTDHRDDVLLAHRAHDDVPQFPFVGILAVSADMKFFYVIVENGDDLFRPLGVNGTFFRFDRPMRIFRVKSDDRFPVLIRNGNLQFIPVSIGFIGAERRLNVGIETRDFMETVGDGFSFHLELFGVFDMLQLTAAALREHGASGADALLGGR